MCSMASFLEGAAVVCEQFQSRVLPRIFGRRYSMTVINFNDLSAGTVVDNEYSAEGVTVSAVGGSGQAMIFDTANPTGGDWDLQTNNLGKALIISEDGDSSDPDDNASGGILRFTFDNPTEV